MWLLYFTVSEALALCLMWKKRSTNISYLTASIEKDGMLFPSTSLHAQCPELRLADDRKSVNKKNKLAIISCCLSKGVCKQWSSASKNGNPLMNSCGLLTSLPLHWLPHPTPVVLKLQWVSESLRNLVKIRRPEVSLLGDRSSQ